MCRTRPIVRYCDWHEFKNRYPDEDGYCAIEALVASRDLAAEIRFEQIDRKDKEKRRSTPRSIGTDIQTQSEDIGPGDVSDQRLERVRINSAFILGYLSKVTGERSWNRRSHTFLNPFKIFIQYHQKMKNEFELLKQKFVSTIGSRFPSLDAYLPVPNDSHRRLQSHSLQPKSQNLMYSPRQTASILVRMLVQVSLTQRSTRK